MMQVEDSAKQWEAGPTWFIISPFSRFRLGWDVVSMLCLFYNLIIVPVRIGWNWTECIDSFLFAFESAIDFFFVADIFINFRTGVPLDDYFQNHGAASKGPKRRTVGDDVSSLLW